jgi:hypothetical protein
LRIRALACALLVASLAPVGVARGSQLVARDAREVTLRVNAERTALVTYRGGGELRRLLAWGAVNEETQFRLDYSGGWSSFRRAVWRTFKDACEPYEGPGLAWLVAACRAPDGSSWALQSWQRTLPFHGQPPSKTFHGAWELRLSHWRGETARLEVWQDWKYSARFESLFGRYTYRGVPVHGPGEDFVRRAYINTFNSGYGPGWWRADALATHRPTGVFCAIFADYLKDRFGVNRGRGERYRITIPGPGVTPDVAWESKALPAWDPADPELVRHEEAMNELIDGPGDTDQRCSEHYEAKRAG